MGQTETRLLDEPCPIPGGWWRSDESMVGEKLVAVHGGTEIGSIIPQRPRTLDERTTYLVTVIGRSGAHRAMTLPEAGRLLLDLARRAARIP
jgi:hypothetical protein